MKAFIVAAMLVACVAGQSMDMMKLNKEYNPMLKFNRPYYPMVRDTNNYNWMDKFMYGGDYEYDTNTYTYDLNEIMSHPMFQEYMELPIFREYFQKYDYFRMYVRSIFFQRFFWQSPSTFKVYFADEALFYKYIYPIVQLFKYDTVSINTYPFQQYMKDYYYGEQERDLVNFNRVPKICHYNAFYCKALLEKFYNHFTTIYGQDQEEIINTPYNRYNPYVARMIQGYYGKYPTVETEMYPYNYYERMYNKDNTVFDKYYNNVENMVTPYAAKYEHFRPTYMGKMFNKKF